MNSARCGVPNLRLMAAKGKAKACAKHGKLNFLPYVPAGGGRPPQSYNMFSSMSIESICHTSRIFLMPSFTLGLYAGYVRSIRLAKPQSSLLLRAKSAIEAQLGKKSVVSVHERS